MRHPLQARIDREARQAVVRLPELMPGVNLMLNRQAPLFRFVINLGCVADTMFSSKGYLIEDEAGSCTYSNWHHATQLFSATELMVEHAAAISEHTTLILSVGIQLGTPITDMVVNPLKHGGCGKIIAVG